MATYIKINGEYQQVAAIYKKNVGAWSVVSNITTALDDGIYSYIDISEWDVSNVTNMMGMFMGCKLLMSVGDISSWNISNVRMMRNMFKHCNVDIIPDWYDITTHDKKVSTDNSMMIEDITLEG